MEELLNVGQVAKLLGIKVSTAYKYAMSGRLPVIKLNGLLRFRVSDLESFIEKCSRPAIKIRNREEAAIEAR